MTEPQPQQECSDCMNEPIPEQYPVYIQPSSEMPQQNSDQLSAECDKILAIIDQLADECNKLFNNTISVNASIRAKVENNAITLYIEITFESNVSGDTISKLCQYLQGQLQPVSNMNFQQCVLPTGTSYTAGNTVTMQLQSNPMNNAPTAGSATGLVSSILVIGFSTYLLHFV
jgi:hypothetical protein